MEQVKNLMLLSFLLILGHSTKAQEFETLVNQLNNQLQKVVNGKYEYAQKATISQPGVIQFSLVKTAIKDGKSEENIYEFNLADLDHNTIKTKTNKDLIQVQLLSAKKQDLIKVTQDREKIAYLNEILVYAADIDNGRELETSFKALIPVAQNITKKRLSLKSYNDHMQWVAQNITDVNLIQTQFAQKAKIMDAHPGKIAISISKNSGKKSTSKTYEFNLMTINPNSILFNISGEEFSIELETRRKMKTIKLFEEGVQQNYISSFAITCNSVETARDLQKVLKSLIPLSQEAFNKTIKKPSSVSEAIQMLNDITQKATVNETTITQNIVGDCVVTFTQSNVSNKGIKAREYLFNFKDLNKNAVQYEAKGKFVYLTITTNGGAKFIKNTEDNEQKNYTNEFILYTPEIEDAIATQKALEGIIELCINQKETYAEGPKNQLIERLSASFLKVEVNDKTYEQKITFEENNNASVFDLIEVSTKSSKQKTYAFNLSDINPASVKMLTSGKNVTVIANTYYLEKIIQYYEDGEIENYQNEIEIQANSIENARRITTLLKKVSGKE